MSMEDPSQSLPLQVDVLQPLRIVSPSLENIKEMANELRDRCNLLSVYKHTLP